MVAVHSRDRVAYSIILFLGGCVVVPQESTDFKLPEITISRREAIRSGAALRYDAAIAGYVPSEKPKVRSVLEGLSWVPVGLTVGKAEELSGRLLNEFLLTEPRELRLKEIQKVLRGVNPQFEGWQLHYEQVFGGATVCASIASEWQGVLLNFAGSVVVDLYDVDDWVLHVGLVQVKPIEGTFGNVIPRDKAKDLAYQALQVDSAKPCEIVRFDLGYAVDPKRHERLIPAWFVELEFNVRSSQKDPASRGRQEGKIIIDARTGNILRDCPVPMISPLERR
jgi:hypothetical protein